MIYQNNYLLFTFFINHSHKKCTATLAAENYFNIIKVVFSLTGNWNINLFQEQYLAFIQSVKS